MRLGLPEVVPTHVIELPPVIACRSNVAVVWCDGELWMGGNKKKTVDLHHDSVGT